MNALAWLIGLGAACLLGVALKRAGREEVSDVWIRQQTRERGMRGWSGAYQEEE